MTAPCHVSVAMVAYNAAASYATRMLSVPFAMVKEAVIVEKVG